MSGALSPEFLALQKAVAGRYSLERELGRGGMGVVFLARDVALDRLIAIKLLPPQLADNGELRARFLREARTAAGLSHPHIVPIHAVEEHGDLVCFVMGYIDGETLRQRVLRTGPLPIADAMRVIQEVAWALDHAHARGVIHRDVKPDNVLLERGTGRALVTDFGIARVAASPSDTGGLLGTPHYMSPEQAEGRAADARSDLYALGVTAWFAVTGKLPFDAPTVAGLLTKQVSERPGPVANVAVDLPPRFAAAIDRCLEKDPARRFPDAGELAEAVRGARGPLPEAPPALRAFVRDAIAAGGEIAVPLMVGAGSLGVYAGFFSQDMFAGFVFLPISALGVGLAGARLGQLFGKARDLVHQGYDHANVRPVVTRENRAIEEEARLTPSAKRGIGRDTVVATVLGAAKTGIFIWLASIDGPVWLNFLGAVGAVMVPATAVRRIWGDARRGRPNLWLKALGGRLGAFLFKAARLGIKDRPLPIPSVDQPTEVALGGMVLALYDGLPTPLRRRFAQVPDLVHRLERDAQILRGHGPELNGRLADAVAALETLRLDLLKLAAGAAGPEELTQDIEAALRIGEAVDAAVEARSEVERLNP